MSEKKSPLDRESQQIDPEKMLGMKGSNSPEDPIPSCPSTQPLPRRGFLGNMMEDDSRTRSPDREMMREPNSVDRFERLEEPTYLSRSYGSNSSHLPHHSRSTEMGAHNRMDISPRKEAPQKKIPKKKRVMSTTANTNFSPSIIPNSPCESPMITQITRGVRLPNPTTPESERDREEYVLRREQQIDPEKQLLRREHPADPDPEDHPQAPSTGPLPRRSIQPAGALKPKALFLEDDEAEESELTFERSAVPRSGPVPSSNITIEERERRLIEMEKRLARELEELSFLRKSLVEREKDLALREKRITEEDSDS